MIELQLGSKTCQNLNIHSLSAKTSTQLFACVKIYFIYQSPKRPPSIRAGWRALRRRLGPAPKAASVAFSGNQVLSGVSKLRISIGWALNPRTGVLTWEWTGDLRRTEDHVETEAEWSQAAWSRRSWERQDGFSLRALWGNMGAPIGCRLWPPELWKDTYLLLCHLACGHLLWQPEDTNTPLRELSPMSPWSPSRVTTVS